MSYDYLSEYENELEPLIEKALEVAEKYQIPYIMLFQVSEVGNQIQVRGSGGKRNGSYPTLLQVMRAISEHPDMAEYIKDNWQKMWDEAMEQGYAPDKQQHGGGRDAFRMMDIRTELMELLGGVDFSDVPISEEDIYDMSISLDDTLDNVREWLKDEG